MIPTVFGLNFLLQKGHKNQFIVFTPEDRDICLMPFKTDSALSPHLNMPAPLVTVSWTIVGKHPKVKAFYHSSCLLGGIEVSQLSECLGWGGIFTPSGGDCAPKGEQIW